MPVKISFEQEIDQLVTQHIEQKIYYWGISLGSLCHTAMTLKRVKLKHFSTPFDWIFSSPEVVTHMLNNNFQIFLDQSYYQEVLKDEKLDNNANIAQHLYYLKHHHLKFMFNHHSPLTQKGYHYFERCVSRFRQVMHNKNPKLMLIMMQRQISKNEAEQLINALNRFKTDYLLLIFSFIKKKESHTTTFKRLEIGYQHPQLFIIELPILGRTDGVVFSDPRDTYHLESLIKAFVQNPAFWV